MYANLTIQLYRTVDSSFFRVLGAVYAIGTLILWAMVFVRTLTLVRNGAIFVSPCLEDFDMARGVEKRQVDAHDDTAHISNLNRSAGFCTGTSSNSSAPNGHYESGLQ